MLKLVIQILLSAVKFRECLILENAALRHQLEVLQRNSSRQTFLTNHAPDIVSIDFFTVSTALPSKPDSPRAGDRLSGDSGCRVC
jgi:hypothetical protein